MGKIYKPTLKRVLYLNSNNATKTQSTATSANVKNIAVLTPGAGYTSTPTATFSGGNPTTAATATCYLTPTSLNSNATITAAGSEYTGTPIVSMTNNNNGWYTSITPLLTATTLASVTVNSGGNYSTAPTSVTFSGGGATTQATGTIVMAGNAISSITINTAGSGYTSTPTITINGGVVVTAAVLTPILTGTSLASITILGTSNFITTPTLTVTVGKQNDGTTNFGGTGATATALLVATTLAGFTITNIGAGYSSAPTVTISGGGATTQGTAVAYLAEVNKTYTFSWNIPEINIYELGEVQVASIASTNASATAIYTFRLNNLSTLANNSYSSDGGQPILFSLLLNNYNSMFRDDFGIYLSPQSINSITISTSDDITQRDVGISNSVGFVLCLVITDNQIELNEIGNPYQDAKDEINNRIRR